MREKKKGEEISKELKISCSMRKKGSLLPLVFHHDDLNRQKSDDCFERRNLAHTSSFLVDGVFVGRHFLNSAV